MMARNVPPRGRLLQAADDLFFKEGIRPVGVNRVLEESQTSIMSLYRNFGSKDGLAAEYLERRGERLVEEVGSEVMRRATTPRDRILAAFDVLREGLEQSGYRGCPFINAAVEMAAPDHELAQIARRHKDAGRQWFAEFVADAGVPDAEGLAVQLTLLADGASVAGVLFQDSSGARYARAAAETLLDAAIASSPPDGAPPSSGGQSPATAEAASPPTEKTRPSEPSKDLP